MYASEQEEVEVKPRKTRGFKKENPGPFEVLALHAAGFASNAVPLGVYRKASAKKLRELSKNLRQLAKRIDEIGTVNSIPTQSDRLFQSAGELHHALIEIVRYAGALRWRVKKEGWR